MHLVDAAEGQERTVSRLQLDAVTVDFGRKIPAVENVSLGHWRGRVRRPPGTERVRKVDAAQRPRRFPGSLQRACLSRRRAADRPLCQMRRRLPEAFAVSVDDGS
ncbi:MAG: hypothetical protein WDN31_18615 [Hyphomicrobium sp.]